MELVWYFLFYSAVGFLLEVVFTRVTGGTKKDRKCMLLLVYFVQPAVEQLTAMMPEDIIAAFGAMFLLDWFFTGQVLRRSHSTQSLRWWVRSIPAGEALSGSAPLSLRASGQRQSPDSPSIP